MTNDVTTTDKTDRRKLVGTRLKAACDSMVEEGLQFEEAARKANLTVRAMRLALKRPSVIAYLKQARQVFLAQVGASNVRRLRDLRDQDFNRAAAVAAARTIEELLVEPTGRPALGSVAMPGLTIQIINAPAPMIDVTPVPPRPIEQT